MVILRGCDDDLRSVKNLFCCFRYVNSVNSFVGDTIEVICDDKFLVGNTEES
jgi:hypothetical protein